MESQPKEKKPLMPRTSSVGVGEYWSGPGAALGQVQARVSFGLGPKLKACAKSQGKQAFPLGAGGSHPPMPF